MASLLCTECDYEAAVYLCEQCADEYCEMCYKLQHRTGNRAKHVRKQLIQDRVVVESKAAEPNTSKQVVTKEEEEGDKPSYFSCSRKGLFARLFSKSDTVSTAEVESGETPEWFVERSKYIPLRLPLSQRKSMRLIMAILRVNQFADVECKTDKEKVKNQAKQLQCIQGVLLGICVSLNFELAQDIMNEKKELSEFASFFQTIFELGRRHKIRNPEKLRSEYGKLLYLLQLCQQPEVLEHFGFPLVCGVSTVHGLLSEHDLLDVMRHPSMAVATGEIIPDGKNRGQLDREIRRKDTAITTIGRQFRCQKLSEEDVRRCVLSMADNHNFLRYNRDPCDIMINHLVTCFHPQKWSKNGLSLAIADGENGARLTHSHEQQYQFVLQTLTLWRNILHEMYMLWLLAEEDILDQKNPFNLRDTGQGIQRVQECPRVLRAMRRILYDTQQQLGSWVGSSVIHLGDDNVPNALMFIDKYTQVSRVLIPIVTCLRNLDRLMHHKGTSFYVNHTFGSLEKCKLTILADFFRSGFDGSGADSFYSAGSCVDGRLTSVWNWCNSLSSKPFYSVFLLTGHQGFDGKF